MQDCFQERALYFWRHGLFGHAKEMCEIGFNSTNSNLILFLWHGLALAKLDRFEYSLMEVEKLEKRKDLILVFNTAQYFVHKEMKEKDDSKIKEFYSSIKELSDTKNSFSSLNASFVAFLFEDYELAEDILKKSEQNDAIMSLLGWIYLSMGKKDEALKIFNKILEDPVHALDLLPLYGKATALVTMGRASESFQIHSRIISKYNFPEIMIEKARAHQVMGNWSLSLSVVSDFRKKLISDFEYLILDAIDLVLSKDSSKRVPQLMEQIFEILQKFENDNLKLIQDVSLLFATLCSTNLDIINVTIKIAKFAADSPNSNSMSHAILGFHHMLEDNSVMSLPSFQKALEKDPQNKFASDMQLFVLLGMGRYNEVKDQIDMTSNLGTFDIATALIQYTLSLGRTGSESFAENLLKQLEKHIEENTFHHEVTQIFNPDTIIQKIISMRMDLVSRALEELLHNNNVISLYNDNEHLNRIFALVTKLEKAMPSFQPVKYVKALALKKLGKNEESLSAFQRLLLYSNVYKPAHCFLYITELLVDSDDLETAKGYFEDISKYDQNMINTLDYQLLNFRINATPKTQTSMIYELFEKYKNDLNDMAHYIKFIDMCILYGEYGIPAQLLRNASQRKTSTSLEKALLVSRQAIILGSKGHFDKVDDHLRKLKENKKYAHVGYEAQANIVLKFKKDQKEYLKTFDNLVEFAKEPNSYQLAGDAYRSVNQFDRASSLYEAALETKKPDVGLLRKLILTLVSSHRFDEAANIFVKCSPFLHENVAVLLTLIKVLITLKRYKEAEKCIASSIRLIGPDQSAVHADILGQKGFVLMKLKKNDEAEKSLISSVQKYESILSDDKDNRYVNYLRQNASNVCVLIGENYDALGRRDKAMEYYNKSLQLDGGNQNSILSLFKAYKQRYDNQKCQKICLDFLEKNPYNETVLLLYTTSIFRDYTQAIKLLGAYLEKNPKSYRSLVRYVELCAREGKINQIKAFIDKYKDDDASGLSFARGMFYMYISDLDRALQEFQKSVLSNPWRTLSQLYIFSILVNPEKKYIWMENDPLSTPDSIQEAEKLLKKIRVSEVDKLLLRAELVSAINTDEAIQSAYNIVQEAYVLDRFSTAVQVANARYLARLGKTEDAIKAIEPMLALPPFHENTSCYEEAYLLKAHITSPDLNPKIVHHFIFLAIDLNKSCRKAWEMNGIVHMKNKMWNEASISFAKCWELCNQNDPEIGYKYSLCSLQARKPLIALQVARKVMELDPIRQLKDELVQPAFKLLNR